MHSGYSKYRAILGNDDGREFAVVTVMDTGTVSWAIISEQEYDESPHADLPAELYAQVSAVFEKLDIGPSAREIEEVGEFPNDD